MSFLVDVAEQVLFWIALNMNRSPGSVAKTRPVAQKLQTVGAAAYRPWFFFIHTQFLSTAKWS